MIAQIETIAKREPNFGGKEWVCGIAHQAGVGVVLACTCSENQRISLGYGGQRFRAPFPPVQCVLCLLHFRFMSKTLLYRTSY